MGKKSKATPLLGHVVQKGTEFDFNTPAGTYVCPVLIAKTDFDMDEVFDQFKIKLDGIKPTNSLFCEFLLEQKLARVKASDLQ